MEDSLDSSKVKLKRSRKGSLKVKWTEDLENDLIDIICSNEHYKRKLILINSRTASNAEVYEKVMKEMSTRCQERDESFQFTLDQTRNKFKKCMSICKSALLTLKTASGIKRFQDEKEYGKWFDTLLPSMKTRVSCQPEQAIEPSASGSQSGSHDTHESSDVNEAVSGSADSPSRKSSIDNDILNDLPSCSNSTSSASSSASKKDMFVPVKTKSSSKSSMSKKIEATNVQVTEVLGQIKSVLEKESNSTKDILDFLEKENERARQHESELFKIMFQTPLNAQYHIPFNIQSTQPPLNTQNHPPTDVQPIEPETQRNMSSLNCNGQLPLSSYRPSSIAINSAMNNNAF